MLKKALASIEHTFQRRAATSLLSSRGAVLPAAGEASGGTGKICDFKPMNATEPFKRETSIAPLLHCIRGMRVILDTDLAKLYGVQTFRLTAGMWWRRF